MLNGASAWGENEHGEKTGTGRKRALGENGHRDKTGTRTKQAQDRTTDNLVEAVDS